MEFRQKKDTGEKHPNRYYSSRQEKSVAKAINGRTTPNSGATLTVKGDVISGDMRGFLYECKTCTKDQKSFTLQEAWFKKNLEESIFMKKDYTAIVFNFGPDKPNYYVLDERTFLEMKDALEKVNSMRTES